RYYAQAGADDSIVIDIPRGSYVPVFRYRAETVAKPAASTFVGAAARLSPAQRLSAAAAILIALGLVVAAGLAYRSGDRAGMLADAERLRPGNGMPVLAVLPFEVAGTPLPRAVSADALRDTIIDTFAHFDLVNVVGNGRQADPAPGDNAGADYRLLGHVEYGEAAADVRFRLIRATDNGVLWSRTFERIPAGDESAKAAEAIARELAVTLVQPFGVIYADGQDKNSGAKVGDARYKCVLEAIESFRSFDADQHLRARACLERLTSIDKNFALGFTYLAWIYLREYQYNLGVRAGDAPPLERALRAAQRGVELNPESSRAHETLSVVLFARRELPAAFAVADKAIKLNKYDMRAVGSYGARLIAAGEIDKGMDMLQTAGADGALRPPFEQFFLFLGSYLRGDLARASFHAGQLTNDQFQLGLIARALVAASRNDRAAARDSLERLVALNPAWRDDVRGSLRKFFYAEAIVDRLAADLAAAGLAAKP
ncbi:MAG TPA: hypothetical protein VEH75_05250, partial [Xanthobacteraceae bacterium]|nr:hypothetical protein [Xanthobacteraceae bacterium]